MDPNQTPLTPSPAPQTTPAVTPSIMPADSGNKNLSKEDTLAMISHELRTSLTASKWIIQMLLDGDVGEMPVSQKEMVSKLASSNARMMDIATNIIMLAKTTTDESAYHFHEVDMVDMVDSVVFELGTEAFSQHIDIVFIKPDKPLPKVKGDDTKLRIVFQNVIDNALKYSKSGDRIVISTSSTDDMATIIVKDTGIGIAPNDLALVRKEFYRAQNAEEKSKVGSGIGLYICDRIVEAHGGKMNIESTVGAGTTVSISLPIIKA